MERISWDEYNNALRMGAEETPDWIKNVWGDTQPGPSGWEIKKVAGPTWRKDAYIIGKRGQKGCASVLEGSDRHLDVVIFFDHAPEEVAKKSVKEVFETYGKKGPVSFYPGNKPGWGHTVIREIDTVPKNTRKK